MHLRRIDPPTEAGLPTRLYARLATTRLARLISRRLGWRLDPLLLRLTRGRLCTTLMIPAGLLETRGAQTGAHRRNAVIYFHDGDRVTIVASNAGLAHHPAWYHNASADPHVVFDGVPMVASRVTDAADLDRLWALADRVFPAFARYREEAAAAGRTIPVLQLARREPAASGSDSR